MDLCSLFEAIAAKGAPAEAPRGAAFEPQLASPWTAWALVCAVRRRRRQRWLVEIVRTRLGADVGLIGERGFDGHPKHLPGEGAVPGMPGWRYGFHGIGCWLQSDQGEHVDMDFNDELGDVFDEDDWFFRVSLDRSTRREPPEQRLCELHGAIDTLRISLGELRTSGLMVPSDNGRPGFVLGPRVMAAEGAILAFAEAWGEPPRRRALAEAIGDFGFILDEAREAGDLGEAERAKAKLEQARAQRERTLRAELGKGRDRALALGALADLGGPGLVDGVREALGDPELRWRALEIARARGLGALVPTVRWQMRSLRLPEESGPWLEAASMLLEHGAHPSEALRGLERVGERWLGEAAIVALEHAPLLASSAFERALWSPAALDRSTAAAALSLLGERWAIELMIARIAGSHDRDLTAESRGALLATGKPAALEAVAAWNRSHPRPFARPSAGPGEGLDEGDWGELRVAEAIDALRGRIARIAAGRVRRSS